MKKNIGSLDKLIRLIIAAVLIVLYIAGILHGALGIILLVVAGALIVTSFTGMCGMYSMLGMSTCPAKGSGVSMDENIDARKDSASHDDMDDDEPAHTIHESFDGVDMNENLDEDMDESADENDEDMNTDRNF